MTVNIELLYVDDCPGAEQLLTELRERIEDAPITLTVIATHEDAVQHRFLGSPTLRINGHDLEAGAEQRDDYGLKCRLYGTSNVPPPALLEAALRR